MAAAPKSLMIRSYHVGFGDCFLLSFAYGPRSERHVLIDFGSTGLPGICLIKPENYQAS